MIPVWQVLLAVVIGVVECIPQFQTHQRKAVHALAIEPQSGVFPVPEPLFLVDILICQIEAAGIGNIAVNDSDLPVVPVVHHRGKCRSERVERQHMDSRRRKFFPEIFRQTAHAPDRKSVV